MSGFPTLKTGAVAQYPLDRTVGYQTQAVKFMDGSRQSFRLRGPGLRRWKIRLELLDDGELAAVTQFLNQQSTSVFSFTDPVTGIAAATCVISGQSYDVGATDELNTKATVEIEEIA